MTDLGDFKRDTLPGLVRQAETRGYDRAASIVEGTPTTQRDRIGSYQLPAREYRSRLLKALSEGRKP